MEDAAENDNNDGLDDEEGDGAGGAVSDGVSAFEDSGLGRDGGPGHHRVGGGEGGKGHDRCRGAQRGMLGEAVHCCTDSWNVAVDSLEGGMDVDWSAGPKRSGTLGAARLGLL